MKLTLKFLLVAAIVFSSCTSIRDIVIDSYAHQTQAEIRLAEVAAAVVPLEAVGGTEARRRQGELSSARQLIAAAEREASADPNFSGQLIAWSGRLAILEGRYSEAVRLHRQSNVVSPGNIPAIILGIHLEGDPQRRLEIIDIELSRSGAAGAGAGELNIERGRTLIDLNRFLEAVGAFDVAFASGLDSVYIDSYMSIRNSAWELRNTVGIDARTLDLLARGAITWGDSIALVASETQLLRFITAGRPVPNAELFNRLVDRGFIPFTQDITSNNWPETRPVPGEIMTRSGAAWFIWHLYAETRGDRGLLTRYSARFATGPNPRSPIADVPALSPFFDSILGCVELDFLSLPDGRNFRPDDTIRGTELLAVFRRIDR
ncbi:MAG: hypothetical protein FWC97_09985 [Treponema sp.]|nr:hypothetical protein [Treponema sp.]